MRMTIPRALNEFINAKKTMGGTVVDIILERMIFRNKFPNYHQGDLRELIYRVAKMFKDVKYSKSLLEEFPSPYLEDKDE